MASALPRARTEVVPGAGHAVHLEQPDRVAAVLARDER
jgi:pimeloyl-ACP methyl ester carboxylesterase